MLDTRSFGQALKARGFGLFSGVPCSFLTPLINYAINECGYIPAANEGDAVAMAAGAALTGAARGAALMQNSGLANAISPLTSLNATFRLPILGIVSLRGEPGAPDEPQHELMGRITTRLLDDMEIPWALLGPDAQDAGPLLDQALEHIAKDRTFFLVAKKGAFAPEPLRHGVRLNPVCAAAPLPRRAGGPPSLSRGEALGALIECRRPDSFIVATTGYTGRQLHDLQDHAQHFYLVGSMGCAGSLSLGIARAKPAARVICVDGDGSALMRLGGLATLGACGPRNLFYLLLDNEAYESTGGQETVSSRLSWSSIAAGCNFPRVLELQDLSGLRAALRDWQAAPALTFASVKVKAAPVKLGRPGVSPLEVRKRAQAFFAGLGD